MKKLKSILCIFALLTIFPLIIVGCSSGSDSAGSSSSKNKNSTETADTTGSTTDSSSGNSGSGSDSSSDRGNVYKQETPADVQEIMNNLTGSWQQSTPLADGSVSVVRVKIDNVSGFTITTGTQYPDGNGDFYSRVGSYQIDGDTITFSATTGGPSTDGSSYQLRQDPGVFKYKMQENAELTQLVLTPDNEKAVLLTGEGPVTLTK